MISRITLASISVVILAGLLWPTNARAEFSVPAGSRIRRSSVPEPTAFDWLPGGDLLITTQRGVLFRWDGAGDAQPVLDLSGAVCAGGEMAPRDRGRSRIPIRQSIHLSLLHPPGRKCGMRRGQSREPGFRFTIDGSGAIGGETVLIDNIAAPGGNHNGGDLQFDRNGLLYVS